MTTHIDQLTSDVIPRPEPPEEGQQSGDRRWEELDRLRRASQRLRLIEQRTQAEGFDD